MSRAVEESIRCPSCGNEQPFVLWQSLNVTLDPEKKQELLEGRLTRFTCGKCGQYTEVVYRLLYHDMERRLMVWLVPPDPDGPPAEEPAEALSGPIGQDMRSTYTFRRVASRNELVEKVHVADAGLDDGLIEILKLMILADAPADVRGDETAVYFAGVDQDGGQDRCQFVLVGPEGQSGANVPLDEAYGQAMADFGEPMRTAVAGRGAWPVVDAALAMAVATAGIEAKESAEVAEVIEVAEVGPAAAATANGKSLAAPPPAPMPSAATAPERSVDRDHPAESSLPKRWWHLRE